MLAYMLLIGAGMLAGTHVMARSESLAGPPQAASGGGGRSQEQGYATQTSQGAVTLDLRPQWEGGRLVIGIAATTHSGDLSQISLQDQVRLVVEADTLAPVETGALRGHHGQASVAFRLAGKPQRFTVIIRDVPDEPLRILKWPAGPPES